jgi:LPXTG-site transpeptidase (sortase) family protein
MRTAVLLVAVGLVAVGAGAVGLAVTRHPDVPRAATLAVLPAPTGPIEAAPRPGAAQVAEPVSLVIPTIEVSTSLVHLGLTSGGALQVPPTTAVAGWYAGSPRPGAIGSAVIAGHIDSVSGPGVFFRLSQLQRGDRIYVKRADGTLAVFEVTQVQMYAKDAFPTTAVYGAVPDPELRLITCGGTFDYSTRSYLSNTVAYAKEVS